MASWLEENELLYNKKLNAYKDYRKKNTFMESKAVSIGKDVLILKTWYMSICSRFTCLNKKKSGDGTSETDGEGPLDPNKLHLVERTCRRSQEENNSQCK